MFPECLDTVYGAGMLKEMLFAHELTRQMSRLDGTSRPRYKVRCRLKVYVLSFVPAESAKLGIVDKSEYFGCISMDFLVNSQIVGFQQFSHVYRQRNPSLR